MNKTVSRVLWIVAGVLLIVAGGACMLHPGATLSGLSFLLGMAMLFSGVVDIIIFATAGSSIYGSGWFLVDGILTVLLSIFLLCNQMFTMMTLPYILGMWLLFSGITKFVNSFDLRRFGVRGWGWVTAFGLLMAAARVNIPTIFVSGGLMDPVAAAVTLSVLAGLFLMIQGVVSIAFGCLSGRFWM